MGLMSVWWMELTGDRLRGKNFSDRGESAKALCAKALVRSSRRLTDWWWPSPIPLNPVRYTRSGGGLTLGEGGESVCWIGEEGIEVEDGGGDGEASWVTGSKGFPEGVGDAARGGTWGLCGPETRRHYVSDGHMSSVNTITVCAPCSSMYSIYHWHLCVCFTSLHPCWCPLITKYEDSWWYYIK